MTSAIFFLGMFCVAGVIHQPDEDRGRMDMFVFAAALSFVCSRAMRLIERMVKVGVNLLSLVDVNVRPHYTPPSTPPQLPLLLG